MNKIAYIQGYVQKEGGAVSDVIYNTLGSGTKKREAARQTKIDADILAKRTAVQKQRRSAIGSWDAAVKKYGDVWSRDKSKRILQDIQGMSDPIKRMVFSEQNESLKAAPTAAISAPPLHRVKPTVPAKYPPQAPINSK